MKPPYFSESGQKSDKRQVMIAKVVILASSTPAGLTGSESDGKAGKSDTFQGKLEHFLDCL